MDLSTSIISTANQKKMASIKKPKRPLKTASVKSFQNYEQKVKDYTEKLRQRTKDEAYKQKLLSIDLSKVSKRK